MPPLALFAAERVTTLAEGVKRAASAVADGRRTGSGRPSRSGFLYEEAKMAGDTRNRSRHRRRAVRRAALALYAPELEVVGLAATAGNVPRKASDVHILVEQLDPPRWPRIGAALPVDYEVDGRALHGPNGLSGVEFPCVQLHHTHPSDKLISDLARMYRKEVAVLLLGPATVFTLSPGPATQSYAGLVERIIMVGEKAWRKAGAQRDERQRSSTSIAIRSPPAR